MKSSPAQQSANFRQFLLSADNELTASGTLGSVGNWDTLLSAVGAVA